MSEHIICAVLILALLGKVIFQAIRIDGYMQEEEFDRLDNESK